MALSFMEYPNRLRLKILGRVRLLDVDSEHWRNWRCRIIDLRSSAASSSTWKHSTGIARSTSRLAIRNPRSSDLVEPLVEENRALKRARRAARTIQSGVLGDGPLELVVAGVRQLTPRIRAFELRHPDDAELPSIEPGSHLRVPVRLANGKTVIRHYSIFSDPARRDVYEIAVLREEQGTSGSRAVHESFELGLRRSGKKLHVPADQTLLDAMLEAGIDVRLAARPAIARPAQRPCWPVSRSIAIRRSRMSSADSNIYCAPASRARRVSISCSTSKESLASKIS
jgi:hypothetical protein